MPYVSPMFEASVKLIRMCDSTAESGQALVVHLGAFLTTALAGAKANGATEVQLAPIIDVVAAIRASAEGLGEAVVVKVSAPVVEAKVVEVQAQKPKPKAKKSR